MAHGDDFHWPVDLVANWDRDQCSEWRISKSSSPKVPEDVYRISSLILAFMIMDTRFAVRNPCMWISPLTKLIVNIDLHLPSKRLKLQSQMVSLRSQFKQPRFPRWCPEQNTETRSTDRHGSNNITFIFLHSIRWCQTIHYNNCVGRWLRASMLGFLCEILKGTASAISSWM